LFDGLFRSSDNNLRNILVSTDKKHLISIDEGDIFGKRKTIFESSEWCKTNEWFLANYEQLTDEFIYGDNKEARLATIINKMHKYQFDSSKIDECIARYNNYKNIIRLELKT
jgi:hypothetical protein